MLRMKCLPVVAGLLLGLCACPNGDPGELRPLFDEVSGLPGFDHPPSAKPDPDHPATPEDGWPRFEMGIRNIGDGVVTVDTVEIREAEGAPGEDESFGQPAIDLTEIEPDAQGVVRFFYVTPGGQGQRAELVILSDATNGELVIPLESSDYVAPPEPDAGPDPDPMDAGPDPDPMDAGPGEMDAGTADAA